MLPWTLHKRSRCRWVLLFAASHHRRHRRRATALRSAIAPPRRHVHLFVIAFASSKNGFGCRRGCCRQCRPDFGFVQRPAVPPSLPGRRALLLPRFAPPVRSRISLAEGARPDHLGVAATALAASVEACKPTANRSRLADLQTGRCAYVRCSAAPASRTRFRPAVRDAVLFVALKLVTMPAPSHSDAVLQSVH